MPRKVLKDDEGNEYEIDLDDLPAAAAATGAAVGDAAGDILELPEEALEWLISQYNEHKEAARRSTSSGQQTPPTVKAKTIRILPKQAASTSAGSSSQSGQSGRRKVLKLRSA